MCNSTSRFNVSRRQFLQRDGLAAAAAGTFLRSTIARADPPDRPAPLHETPAAGALLNGTAALCCPQLEPSSQLSFRLGLALGRTAAYPLDNLDFILMDLERPDGRSRHAHWCTGDLSGRMLEFLAVCEGLDGRSDSRLPELFARIMKQRQPSGHISRYWYRTDRAPEFSPEAGSSRLFVGLVRYHDLTGDPQALDAATTMAEHLWAHRDWWRKNLPAVRRWITEPFARLYAITKEPRWLEFCGMIGQRLGAVRGHSHGLLSVLRGLQVAALVTGDLSWNETPELVRQTIIEKRVELPNGDIAESFPMSPRTNREGCGGLK